MGPTVTPCGVFPVGLLTMAHINPYFLSVGKSSGCRSSTESKPMSFAADAKGSRSMSLKHHLQTDWRIEPEAEDFTADFLAPESAPLERESVVRAATPAMERRAVRREIGVRIGDEGRGLRSERHRILASAVGSRGEPDLLDGRRLCDCAQG